MNAPVTRREFLHQSTRLGALAFAATFPWSRLAGAAAANDPAIAAPADLGIIEGDDYYENTLRALALLGGMSRFVKPGHRVALLINAPRWWTKPGSFTSPEVSLAVVKACADAGAKEMVTIVDPPGGYWRRSRHAEQCAAALARVQSASGGRTTVNIPKGRALKQAEISRALLEADVVINVPIAKHHAGTGFTGCLKNMMGACSGSTNRFFHNGSGASSEYGDVVFLSQCIADVNLVRKPDLNVCDATEFLLTNGPAGPGELGHARAVVAGTDPVAVDAYCASTFLNLRPTRVDMIRQAFQHEIGEIDWTKLTVRKESV
ncbi:DUF362 domain-containing protein [Opitutus terrae]|uniref:DUF362 domain-containing protein n=1 Tax=Opitutus terrae (strain DSM 11246 / JCM 15787 / PB90-1) TaxID=452637 RepID=B1ZNQ0_OPITP|nr:DUF362 domain-containing protein [Opitutus terrae]ACB75420.1 protein of unknown function DUF362 [Opitutus terrae PB90-1]